MRPVVRGDCPTDDDGKEVEYTNNRTARGALIGRMGEYCSYCNMHLDTSLAVEHVQPKQPDGVSTIILSRDQDWDNYLLGCTNCNSTKGNTDVVLDDYFWPDRDNTLRAIKYSEGGLVSVNLDVLVDHNGNPDHSLQAKAKNIIELTGLDKTPDVDSEARDRRWLNRSETWDLAVEVRTDLAGQDTPVTRKHIVHMAKGKGYWGVWMTVFKDDPDMLRRLIDAFPGTAKDCFDTYGKSIKRPSGKI